MPTRTILKATDLDAFVPELLGSVPRRKGASIITLSGELGAGKTALTQAIARYLGVQESVVSPTFVIMRLYETANENYTKLVHIDAYRFEEVREAEVLGIPKLMEEEGYLFVIEWPEQMESHIPEDALRVTITPNDDESRTITYGN